MSSYAFDTFLYNLVVGGYVPRPVATTISIVTPNYNYFLNRAGIDAIKVDNTLYIIGGFNQYDFYPRITIYNTETGKVSNEIDLPTSLIFHYAELYDNAIYIYGGDQAGDDINKLYKFDIESESITELSSSEERLYFSMDLYNSKLYVTGGYNDDNYFDNLLVYDIESDTWETIGSDLTFLRRYRHASIVIGNDLYIFGGIDESGNLLNDLWRINLNDLSFEQVNLSGDVPHSRYNCRLVSYDNYLYIINGMGKWRAYSDIIRVNLSNGICESMCNFSAPRSDFDYIIHNDYVILLGGYDGVAQFIKDVTIYDIENNVIVVDTHSHSVLTNPLYIFASLNLSDSSESNKYTLRVIEQGLGIFHNDELIGYFDETGYHIV